MLPGRQATTSKPTSCWRSSTAAGYPNPGAAPLGSGGRYSQQSQHRTSLPGESSRRTVTRWRFSTKPVCRLPTVLGEYSRPRHLGHVWMSFQLRVRKCGLVAPSHGARWQAFSITLW